MAERARLVADLDDAVSGLLVRGPHELRLLHVERHRLFDVDVLAGIHGRDEGLGVQVLRRGDQDGIERRDRRASCR